MNAERSATPIDWEWEEDSILEQLRKDAAAFEAGAWTFSNELQPSPSAAEMVADLAQVMDRIEAHCRAERKAQAMALGERIHAEAEALMKASLEELREPDRYYWTAAKDEQPRPEHRRQMNKLPVNEFWRDPSIAERVRNQLNGLMQNGSLLARVARIDIAEDGQVTATLRGNIENVEIRGTISLGGATLKVPAESNVSFVTATAPEPEAPEAASDYCCGGTAWRATCEYHGSSK